MSLDLAQLEKRKQSLIDSLQASVEFYDEMKDRCKIVRLEIANAKGAILELERLLEGNYESTSRS